MFRAIVLYLLIASSTLVAAAGRTNSRPSPVRTMMTSSQSRAAIFRLRGGDLQSEVQNIVENQAPSGGGPLAACLMAGGICGASDIVAQLLLVLLAPAEEKRDFSLRRTGGSATAGLLTLGLAAPAFYDVMKSRYPSGTTENFVIKLLIGNCIYGSVVAVAYYIAAMKTTSSASATSCLKTKIKRDLPKFIGFGVVFWGLVYPHHEKVSIIIPFFIWTTLLSMNAHA